MDEQQQNNTEAKSDSEHTKQVTAAAWTAGVSAFFALAALGLSRDWPTTVGVIGVMAAVAVACYFMLKPR